jgi:acyl-coenzyme A thioesterase PaaI-like protein
MILQKEISTSPFATNPSQEMIDRLCAREHANCFACRSIDNGGLGLLFRLDGQGVKSLWTCPADKESYAGIVHGGILATALDSSMVHALFSHGIVASTGQFELRYRNSVHSDVEMEITASVREHRHPLYVMEAAIHQAGTLCVSAKAKFMAMDTPAAEGEA